MALRSAMGLAARGHKVIFFTSHAPERDRLRKAGIEVVEFLAPGDRTHPPRTALSRIWNASAARQFAELLDRVAVPDMLIHLHGWNKALSPSIIPVARARRIALICTLHDYAVACPRGTFYDLGRRDICTLRPLSMRCLACDCAAGERRRKLLSVAQRLTLDVPAGMHRAVDCFIAVSQASGERLRPHLPRTSGMVVIDNPVLADAAAGDRIRAEDNDLFAVIGRITVEKGARLAAQAGQMARLPMVFVGEGPAEADVARHYPSARLTGWESPAGVSGWLARAKALVFPSLMPETQGLVVAEAAARGIPALVGTRTAAASFVTHGVTGLHFEHGRASALAEAMTRLARDHGLAASLSRQAHAQFWRAPATVAAHVTALEDLYTRVLRGKAGELGAAGETR